MKPPRPAAISRDKVLLWSKNSRARTAIARPQTSSSSKQIRSLALLCVGVRWSVLVSLALEQTRRRCLAGEFRHRTTLPISLWVATRQSLGKRRQRAHRRRFARSPRFQNRAGLKIVGAANDLRNTRCAASRNDLIRARRVKKFLHADTIRVVVHELESKFLNRRAESQSPLALS